LAASARFPVMKFFRCLVFMLLGLLFASAGRVGAQWVQMNGPFGGTPSQIQNVGSRLICLAAEGLFISNDSGKSWNRLHNAPPNLFEMAVIGSTIVAGGNQDFEPFFVSSSNDGNSWGVSYGSGIEGVYALDLVASGNCLYVIATDDVIPSPTIVEISTDEGQSWSAPWDSVGLYPKGRINGLFTANADLFAESDSGFYRSSDSGKSWVDMTDLFPKTATVFSFGSEFFAVSDSGLMQSFDEGNLWSDANNGLGNARVNNIFEFAHGWLAWTDSGIFESTNLGALWSYAGAKPSGSYSLAASGEAILAGVSDSGIWRSSDLGVTWKHVGLNCLNVDQFATLDSTIFVAMHTWSYHGQIWRSSDEGASWQLAVDSMFSEYLFNPISCLSTVGTTLYATGNNAYQLAASTDMGNTWKPRIQSQQGIQLGMVIALIARNDTMYAGTDSYGIFSSLDSGKTWKLLDTGLFDFKLDNKYTLALAIAGSNILAGTNDTGIFLSTDGGARWVPSNNGLTISSIYAFAEMGRYVFAGTGGAVYRSSDNGVTWAQANTGIGGSLIGNFAVDNKYIFAASGSGIFFSSDTGMNWRNIIDNLPDSSISELLIAGDNFYAGTRGDGVWRRPLSDLGISSVSAQPISITQDILSYPNPFS
jgi:photosystem II stability/assembly factor-like uncharacterized protein